MFLLRLPYDFNKPSEAFSFFWSKFGSLRTIYLSNLIPSYDLGVSCFLRGFWFVSRYFIFNREAWVSPLPGSQTTPALAPALIGRAGAIQATRFPPPYPPPLSSWSQSRKSWWSAELERNGEYWCHGQGCSVSKTEGCKHLGIKAVVAIIFRQRVTNAYFRQLFLLILLHFSQYSPEIISFQMMVCWHKKNMLISLQNFKVFYIFVLYFQVVLSTIGNSLVASHFYGTRH